MSIKYSVRLLNFTFAVILLIVSALFIINLDASMKKIDIFVFLEKNLEEEKVREIGQALKELKEVESVRFSSSDEVVKDWVDNEGRKQLIEIIAENPFPPLFRINLKKSGNIKELHRTASAIKNFNGVKTVEYGGQKTEEAIRKTKRFLVAYVFVFLASLINILNYFFTIKDLS